MRFTDCDKKYSRNDAITIHIENRDVVCYDYSEYSLPIVIRDKNKSNELSSSSIVFDILELAFGSCSSYEEPDPRDEDKLNTLVDIPVLELILPGIHEPSSLYTSSIDYNPEKTYLIDSKFQSDLTDVFNCGRSVYNPISEYEKFCERLYRTGAIYSNAIERQRFEQDCKYPLLQPAITAQIVNEYFAGHSSITFVSNFESVFTQLILKKAAQEKMRKQKQEEEQKQKAVQEEALRRALEARRQQLADEYKKQQEHVAELQNYIVQNFENTQLLTHPKLTRTQKMNEYAKVLDFCYSYLPALKTVGSHVERILPMYATEPLLTACSDFSKSWRNILGSHRGLQQGAEGEYRVAKLLNLYDEQLVYISDYTWNVEHDFIVLAPSGIYTIEVKNLSGNYELSAAGILKCISKPYKRSFDVAFQSKKHAESLRRNLKSCPAYHSEIPIKHIICSANQDFTINKNDYPYIPVCYTNTLDNHILFSDLPTVMSMDTMNEIKAFLLAHQQPPFTFDVFGPRGELESRDTFINSFASLVVRLDSQNT